MQLKKGSILKAVLCWCIQVFVKNIRQQTSVLVPNLYDSLLVLHWSQISMCSLHKAPDYRKVCSCLTK